MTMQNCTRSTHEVQRLLCRPWTYEIILHRPIRKTHLLVLDFQCCRYICIISYYIHIRPKHIEISIFTTKTEMFIYQRLEVTTPYVNVAFWSIIIICHGTFFSSRIKCLGGLKVGDIQRAKIGCSCFRVSVENIAHFVSLYRGSLYFNH